MKIKILRRLSLSAMITAAVLVTILHTASSFSNKMADDLWKQLGITQTQGTENIRRSFATGYSNIYGLRNVKNIASGNRAAVAKNLFLYTKTYVSSAEFRNYYAKERASYKPIEPVAAKSKEEVRAEMIAEMEKSIRDSEKSMAAMTPDIKKALQPSLDNAKKQLEEFKQPDNKIVEIRYQGELNRYKYDKERYDKDLANWETNYPAELNQLIKARLEKYLSIAATVDFGAELTEKYGKKRFVKPEYESKHSDWKMIYRAGVDIYATIKPLAQDWLKTL